MATKITVELVLDTDQARITWKDVVWTVEQWLTPANKDQAVDEVPMNREPVLVLWENGTAAIKTELGQ